MAEIRIEAGSFGAGRSVAACVGHEVFDVALRGATPLRWLVNLPGGPVDVLDGYRDEAELAAQDGVRNGVMAPFCNRIADARYTFDGVAHDLLPGAADRTIYHGLVRLLPFTLRSAGAHGRGARLTFGCDALSEGNHPGYPYEVEVEVTYDVGPGTLEVEIAGRNVGTTAAPFAAGWHPYFRLPGRATIDGLHLQLPADVAVETDAALVPRAGADAFRPLPADARWEPIGASVVDACYAGLVERDAPVRSVLRDPRTGVRLSVRHDGGLVHVFTGDTLARDRRASLAIEPVEVLTDAFNRPDCATAIRLEPGERRAFRFGVEVSTPRGVERAASTVADLAARG